MKRKLEKSPRLMIENWRFPSVGLTWNGLNNISQKINNPSIKCKYISTLRDFKSKIGQVCDSYERFFDLFLQVWDYLATTFYESPNELGISFPKFYHTPENCNLLYEILDPVFTMKNFFGKKSSDLVGSGGGSLVTGTKGVGKSTLMQVASILLYLLTDFVVPVYIDFSLLPTSELEHFEPLKVMNYVYHKVSDKALDVSLESNLSAFLHSVYGDGKMVILFADEISSLYLPNYNENAVQRRIIHQIASTAKSTAHSAVVSTSHHNFVRTLFYPEKLGFDRYTTLNSTVFQEPKRIWAVRISAEFGRFCWLRWADKCHIGHVFLCTGGLLGSLDAYKPGETDYPALPEIYLTDPFYSAVLDLMASKVSEQLLAQTYWPWNDPHSISMTAAWDLFVKHSQGGQCLSSFDAYFDQQYFYETADGMCELMFPGVLYRLQEHLQSERGSWGGCCGGEETRAAEAGEKSAEAGAEGV